MNRGYFLLVLFCFLFFSCKKEGCTDLFALNYDPDADINNGSCVITTPYILETPYGFPDKLIPSNNPTPVEGVQLGEKLFKDPILSANNT